MKIVYFWAFFGPFLENFYKRHHNFDQMPYERQQKLILGEYFGNGPSYYNHAKKHGHEVQIIISDCLPMQQRWAVENGVDFNDDWKYSVPLEQVKQFRPDVFYIGSMFNYYGDYLGRIKEHCRSIVGWIGCPIPQDTSFQHFSLMLSSHVGFVENFRRLGLNSDLLPAAFDPDILRQLPDDGRQDVPISFVGSLSADHVSRYKLISHLVKKTPMELYGAATNAHGLKDVIRAMIKRRSIFNPLKGKSRGAVFGMEMYRLLQRSRITFNAHIDVAGDRCGNMRMYEATGVGTLLLTDNKCNLHELFVPGREVVVYDNANDAVEKVMYYLDNEDECREIAAAGQRRTLRDHSMDENIKLMLKYFEKSL